MLHENDGPHVQENHTIWANEHFTLLGKKNNFSYRHSLTLKAPNTENIKYFGTQICLIFRAAERRGISIVSSTPDILSLYPHTHSRTLMESRMTNHGRVYTVYLGYHG